MSVAAESPVFYQRPAFSEEQLSLFSELYADPAANDEAYSARLFQLARLGRTIGKTNGLDNAQVVTLMREASWEMLGEGDHRKGQYETVVYAGCQHTKLLRDFDWILAHRPDVLFVTDLAGSDFVTDTQELFYNNLFNHVRQFMRETIGSEKFSTLHEDELMHTVVQHKEAILGRVVDASEGKTVLDGYRALHRYVSERFPKDDAMPDPSDLDGVIGWIAQFTHGSKNHGYWMASLGKDTREKLLVEIGAKTKAIVEKLKLVRDRETQVIMVAGNWDDPDTLDLIAKKGSGEEGGEISGYFDAIAYVHREGFPVYTELGVIETETAVMIVAPFRWMLNRFNRDDRQYQEAKMRAAQARQKGKLIVLYPHSALHLTDSKANRDVAVRTLTMMVDFQVDEVAHGHDHRQPTDRGKYQYPVYEYDASGSAVRMTEGSHLDVLGSTPMGLVVYMPIGESALAIRRKGRRQCMGRSPLPARLL